MTPFPMDFLTILLLLTTGGLGGFLLTRVLRPKPPTTDVRRDATVLLERIEKVFKVVMAEGYFSEIYNYQDQKKILYMLNDPKKAMVIAKAKVLVGFDFAKVRFRQPEAGQKTLVIEHFPEPEVLSIDTDYKFYDINPGLLNHFSSDDYTQILEEAKQVMNERALQSDLPRIANNQVQYMMYQLSESMGWQLQLPPAEQRKLDELTARYDATDATPKLLPPDAGSR
jgi:hypothetical protein